MRKIGGRRCLAPGCPAVVVRNAKWCEEHKREVSELVRVTQDLLFPTRRPFTPRVVAVSTESFKRERQ